MKRIFFFVLFTAVFTLAAYAQPRPVASSKAQAAAAPPSFSAKYEGGMLGYNDKISGTLKFDDANDRLVFLGVDQKEVFWIPYGSILVIYPQSQAVTSTTGNVISHIPLPGAGLAGFIKEKRRYLIMQIDDPDVEAKGALNFKVESKDLLDSVIQSLAGKAKLQQRGDAFYRPRKAAKTDDI